MHKLFCSVCEETGSAVNASLKTFALIRACKSDDEDDGDDDDHDCDASDGAAVAAAWVLLVMMMMTTVMEMMMMMMTMMVMMIMMMPSGHRARPVQARRQDRGEGRADRERKQDQATWQRCPAEPGAAVATCAGASRPAAKAPRLCLGRSLCS